MTSDTGCHTQALGYARGLSAAQVTQLRSPVAPRPPPAGRRRRDGRQEPRLPEQGRAHGTWERSLGRDGQGSTAALGWGQGRAGQGQPRLGVRGARPGRAGPGAGGAYRLAALTGWRPCLPRRSLPQPGAPTVAAGSPERRPPRPAAPARGRPRNTARPAAPQQRPGPTPRAPSLSVGYLNRLRPSVPDGAAAGQGHHCWSRALLRLPYPLRTLP